MKKNALDFKEGKPVSAMSVTDMRNNKTGSWRYMGPLYQDKMPPCTKGCPAGEKIPQYFQFVKAKRYTEAWHTILEDNPLPGVCGRVCYHPCETPCNRKDLDTPIAINSMERFVADQNMKNSFPERFFVEKTDKKIAIIGSGPAGLSAAYFLARNGHKAHIFEALPEAGGMLRMGIPKYRLPRHILDKEISDIQSLGVEITTHCRIGKDKSWQELNDQFDAVLIATGATKSRPMGIPGEELAGIGPGLKFLEEFNLNDKKDIAQKLIVVGGGNTAIDCARSARRLNADVTIVYRRSRAEMPAVPEEIEEAEHEGVKFAFLTNPIAYIGYDKVEKVRLQKMELGAPDEDGRRRPVAVEGADYELYADQVMLAIGEVPDLDYLPQSTELKWGRVAVETHQAINNPNIFACGDAADGPVGTVVDAIATGKHSAFAIHAFLQKEQYTAPKVEEIVGFEEINLDYFKEEPRPQDKMLDMTSLDHNFNEVKQGLIEDDVIKEALRCFSCGTCTYCDNCMVFCPDVAITKNPDGSGYEINYDFCKGCGVCVHECPRNAMNFEEELKWQK